MKKQLLLLCLCTTIAVHQTKTNDVQRRLFGNVTDSIRHMIADFSALSTRQKDRRIMLAASILLVGGYASYHFWYTRGLANTIQGLGKGLTDLIESAANDDSNVTVLEKNENYEKQMAKDRYNAIVNYCKNIVSYMNKYVPKSWKTYASITFTISNEENLSIIDVIDIFLKNNRAISLLMVKIPAVDEGSNFRYTNLRDRLNDARNALLINGYVNNNLQIIEAIQTKFLKQADATYQAAKQKLDTAKKQRKESKQTLDRSKEERKERKKERELAKKTTR